MNREKILAILYEMAIVIGGEIRLRPLLTKTLQRLLFHTSFPCGMVFLDAPELASKARHGELLQVRLEMSVGDFELSRLNGKAVEVPAALLRGDAALVENRDLIATLPCRKGRYRTFLRLPIDECGVILLLAPGTPVADMPFTRIFQPVLSNLAKAILLCRNNEAYTQKLLQDRRLAEEAFQDLAYRNRLILDSVGEGICGLDRSGRTTFVNPAAARMLGYPPEELTGRSLHEVVHHEKADGGGLPAEECPITRTIRDGRLYRVSEDIFHRRDGAGFPVEYIATPLRDGGGIVGAVIVFQDITERKRMEDAVREQQRFAEIVIANSAVATFVLDTRRRVVLWNKACEELTGVSAADMIGTADHWKPFYREERPTLADLIIDNRADRVGDLYGAWGRSPLSEKGLRAEGWYEKLNGKRRFMLFEAVPLHTSKGELSVVIETLYDFTDRKQAENDLKKLNRALLTLSTSNMTLIHASDETRLLQDICRAVVEVGAYCMVWVGFVDQAGEGTLRPVASAGREEGYLETLPLLCGEACGCPPSRAIRSGEPCIAQNIAAAPGDEPWRSEALKRGYAACIALPLHANHQIIGSLNIYAAEENAFTADELGLLNELAGDLSFGIMSLRTRCERDRAVEERQRHLEKLRRVMEDTIQAIASILEMRDPYLTGHQRRVAQLAVAISRELGLSPERIEGIHFGCLIHDIGKIYVPAEFLSRPGRLMDLEFSLIKTHPQVGYDIVKDIEFPWPVAQMIRQHHEHVNGSGYPLGLIGEDIILEARVLVVADVVEAMASHRPYRPARGIDTALEEVIANRGILYDAAVVDACVALFREKGFSFS